MSHLDAKMHAVHAASRLFADAPYQNFRNDAAGRQHDNPAAPLYELRALGQLEYAYRLCKARADVDAICVESAADAALSSFSACGALTPEAAQRVEQALNLIEGTACRVSLRKKTAVVRCSRPVTEDELEKTVEAGAADSREETAEVAGAPTTEEKTEDNII